MNEQENTSPAQPDIAKILERMTAEIGEMPRTMELLAQLRPAMVAEQVRSKQFANSIDTIPEKYRSLVLVAAAAGSGAPTCIRTQVAMALRKGATAEEIIDTLVLARFAVSSSVFSSSLQALEVLAEADGPDE